jgi:hypothetical protein
MRSHAHVCQTDAVLTIQTEGCVLLLDMLSGEASPRLMHSL